MSKTPPPRVNPGGPIVLVTKPKPGPKKPVKPAGKTPPPRVNPGGPVVGLVPVPPPRVNPGGPVVGLRPKGKVKAKKPRTSGLMPCVAVAVAGAARLRTDEVLPYCGPGGDMIEDVLAALAADGLLGDFAQVEPADVPGLVLGLTMDDDTHAALTLGDGLMRSWGLVMPVTGIIDEAWWVRPATAAEGENRGSAEL